MTQVCLIIWELINDKTKFIIMQSDWFMNENECMYYWKPNTKRTTVAGSNIKNCKDCVYDNNHLVRFPQSL